MESPDKKKEEEFGEILKHYAEFLSSHIKKFDLHKYGLDPEDIMQDVRIKIWKLVDDERVIFSHASYMKKIVSSSVIDQLRKFRREDSLFRHERQKHVAELLPSYSQDAASTRLSENRPETSGILEKAQLEASPVAHFELDLVQVSVVAAPKTDDEIDRTSGHRQLDHTGRDHNGATLAEEAEDPSRSHLEQALQGLISIHGPEG